MRPIQATIHRTALEHNLNVVKQHAPHSKVMAVVKANGYGHGLINVAHGLKAADGFAVLGLNEAIDLREAGFSQTILLLEGVFNQQELNIAASFTVDIVVHSLLQIEMLESAQLARPLHVHLKINTGMNRLGFTPSEFLTVFNRLKACNNVREIILMTHFATADEALGIEAPLQLFQKTIQGLNQSISLANSATILRYPQAHTDWVRPGIMLYGASPVSETPASVYGLKPAMELTSEIIGVQTIQSGESVGYGHRFTAAKTTRVGIVACGYADGYPRHAPNDTPIAVNNKLTRTIGRVSMDMLYVDITDVPEANIGAPVELWGSHVSVDAVAEASGTVGYELLCALAPRVPMKVIDGES
ncbi:MAG TPA: alanine racemase [Methylotenera sp.]|nr:alanine racemase [Methylotenera sp.]